MGVATLDNVDKDWVRDQLESGSPFLTTSCGMFELGHEDASALYGAILADEDYPNFSWTTATEVAAYGSAADYITKYFSYAGKGAIPIDDMLQTALDAGRKNLSLSQGEDRFYTHYIEAEYALSLDCYVKGDSKTVSNDFFMGLFNASLFAMSVIVGLRGASKTDAKRFIDKNSAKLKLNINDIYNESARNKFHDDLKAVASRLDHRRGLSDTELLAANAVYYTLLLDEALPSGANNYFLNDFNRRSHELTPFESLALTALAGAYHYLQAPRQDEQVFYVTLDNFDFKSSASELSGISDQGKSAIVKENIRIAIENAYRDIKGVKIAYAKPSNGVSFHTVYIPCDMATLSEIFREHPPSKDMCDFVEKKLSSGDSYQTGSYDALMQKYHISGSERLCETDNYSELMAEPLMILWSSMGIRQGHTNINPGGRRQAESAYVYGHVIKLGVETLTKVSDTAEFQFDASMFPLWKEYLGQASLSVEDKLATIGDFIGSLAAHEMGHILGLYGLPNTYQNRAPHLMMEESGRLLNEPIERHLFCERHSTLLRYFFN